MRDFQFYDGHDASYFGFVVEGGFGQSAIGTVWQNDAGEWESMVRTHNGGAEPNYAQFGPYAGSDAARDAATRYATDYLDAVA